MKRLLTLALLSPVVLSMMVLSPVVLSGCTLLYFPPVPQRSEVQVTPRLTLDEASELRWAGERLELSVTPATVPAEGWLAVQWFSPQNKQVASDSVWLKAGDAFLGHLFLLPGGVEPAAGEWRAALSFRGDFVRQFSAVVPAEK